MNNVQAYHNAHLEAIKGFGMHGYEIDFEDLVEEYEVSAKKTHQTSAIFIQMSGQFCQVSNLCPAASPQSARTVEVGCISSFKLILSAGAGAMLPLLHQTLASLSLSLQPSCS